MTLGVKAPAVIRKVAKYAGPTLVTGSATKRIHPINTRIREEARWKPRSRKRSEDQAVAQSAMVPTAYGATVKRLVLTVE